MLGVCVCPTAASAQASISPLKQATIAASAAAAADWVWARAQPATFSHLVGDRGWPPGDYTERAVRSVLSEVVAPEA